MASDYKNVLAAAALLSNRTEEEIIAELVLDKYGKSYDYLKLGQREAEATELPLVIDQLGKDSISDAHVEFGKVVEWGRKIPPKWASMCASHAREIKVGSVWDHPVSGKVEVKAVGVYLVKIMNLRTGRRTTVRASAFKVPSCKYNWVHMYRPVKP